MGAYDNNDYRGGNSGRYGNANDYGDSVTVRVNGRDRDIPLSDVTMIDFAGNGNVSQSEMNRATQSFDRGLVVMRNGRFVSGRPIEFRAYDNQMVLSTSSGDRTIPLNEIARVYLSNNSGRNDAYNNDPYYGSNNQVYGQYGNRDPYYNQPAYGSARTVTVPTNRTWSNSGIDVRRGDVIHFRASGNVQLSQNPGDYGTPAGANDGRMAGNSPLPGVTGGILIGRVGNSAPFVIGAETDVTMPASGRLYLGVNDDYVGDNSGNFTVEMFPR